PTGCRGGVSRQSAFQSLAAADQRSDCRGRCQPAHNDFSAGTSDHRGQGESQCNPGSAICPAKCDSGSEPTIVARPGSCANGVHPSTGGTTGRNALCQWKEAK